MTEELAGEHVAVGCDETGVSLGEHVLGRSRGLIFSQGPISKETVRRGSDCLLAGRIRRLSMEILSKGLVPGSGTVWSSHDILLRSKKNYWP